MSRRAAQARRCAACDTVRGKLVLTAVGLRCKRCSDRLARHLRHPDPPHGHHRGAR